MQIPIYQGHQRHAQKMKTCKCETPPFYYADFHSAELGVGSHYADVTIQTCKKCGKKWLKFLIEEEHYTKSGRWWRAPVEPEKLSSITAENAKQFIESLDWCFVGGSYYDGKIQIEKRPIKIE